MPERLYLKVEGMDCASCSLTIEKGLSKIKGVKKGCCKFCYW